MEIVPSILAENVRHQSRRRRRSERYLAAATQSLLIVLMGAQFVAGQAAAPNSPARLMAGTSNPLPQNLAADRLQYFIAPDDQLEIKVLDVAELSGEYRVSPDGRIVMPLLSKPIVAAGLTSEELAAVIADRLQSAGLVSTPHVLVTVKSSTANSVAIMGAVKNPQIYPVFGPTTLLDVLSQAGGLAPDAGDTVIVTRGQMAMRASGTDSGRKDSELMALAAAPERVNLQDLLATANPALNLTIYPGDKVMVEQAGIVYVMGAVRRPGGYTLAGSWKDMTVLKAIALAGDPGPMAVEKKTVIIRQDASTANHRIEIPVNLKKVLDGKAPDRALEANDILFVPDSALKKALHVGGQAGVAIGTGLAIYHPY